jgi:hypothetical protein
MVALQPQDQLQNQQTNKKQINNSIPNLFRCRLNSLMANYKTSLGK